MVSRAAAPTRHLLPLPWQAAPGIHSHWRQAAQAAGATQRTRCTMDFWWQ